MKPPQRPKRANGTPLPTKYKQIQEGVLIFALSKWQRVQIGMGMNIKISVTQRFQHRPGHIDVSARLDVTAQDHFEIGDRIKTQEQETQVESLPTQPKVTYHEDKAPEVKGDN